MSWNLFCVMYLHKKNSWCKIREKARIFFILKLAAYLGFASYTRRRGQRQYKPSQASLKPTNILIKIGQAVFEFRAHRHIYTIIFIHID